MMMTRRFEQTHLDRYFQLELARLRALLKRRVLWLRQQWHHSPAQDALNGIVSDRHADWLLTDTDRDAEQRFYLENPSACDFTNRAEALKNDVDRLREQLGSKQTLPMDVLGHVFGLGAFERDVLLLCAAPELDGDFQALFGYVQDNIKRDFPTIHLAYALFGAPRSVPQLSARFNANAPLRRYRLIQLRDEPGPIALRPLSLPERILDYLRGVNHLDMNLQQHALPLPPPLLSPTLKTVGRRVVRAIELSRSRGPFPIVNIIGDKDGGQREVASQVAEELRIKLFELNPTSLVEQDVTALIALLEREALLVQAAYLMDMTQVDEVSSRLKRLLDMLTTQTGFLLFLGNHQRIEHAPRLMNVHLSRLNNQDRLVMWQSALDNAAPLLDIPRIVQQFRFGPTGVGQAVATAHNNAAMHIDIEQQSQSLSMEDVWAACRQQSEWQLDDLAQRIDPAYVWDDLVLQAEELAQLHEIAQQVHYRHRVYVEWGYEQKLNRGRGISVLFSGASGTGKTMAAEVLANALDLPLYRIDLAGVVNKYVGETEKNLRRIFAAAEQSGTILFFDEADALFGKRTDVKDSHDRYANIEVNYLLQLMENYSGLAILATNRRQSLDRAFLRRLRFVVDFPFPNMNSRRRILQRAFPEHVPVGRLDYNQLAQMEIAGGNIHTIALNATFFAAADGGVVEMKHVIAAARREYAKMDKLDSNSMFGEY
ncbi:MAG TPA: ATP-binding protein [Chromatiaceae bacterium]|mgnify:CR=1 FL=1|jgi:hypothetical protein|nr:MAG: hypothetical protein N838_00395 [Thiohalocapsa sp. PB-PSB1]QQO57351.1 MAG: ATP-binding protein [Thiohalocapsa sp. PB-PSB1]HBG94319.1 ATP-binding protein [Chromatiaceae bacterium]HCS88843.1 ATP-binding protein [Chromatiaceae bacterium]